MAKKIPKFLMNKQAAFRWAKKNVGNIKDYVREMNAEQPGLGLGDEFYGRRAEAYSDFAQEVYEDGEVVIYRAILVPKINGVPQISLSNLGKSWSRTLDGVGVYGNIPYEEMETKLLEVVVQGIVKPKDVDWEFGFASFMYYGEDQWEVSLLPNVPVLVTHLEQDELPQAVRGNSGPAQETWRPVEAE